MVLNYILVGCPGKKKHASVSPNAKRISKVAEHNRARPTGQIVGRPRANQTLWEFVRLYENTQYIRPKFHFLTKIAIEMTHLVFTVSLLLEPFESRFFDVLDFFVGTTQNLRSTSIKFKDFQTGQPTTVSSQIHWIQFLGYPEYF